MSTNKQYGAIALCVWVAGFTLGCATGSDVDGSGRANDSGGLPTGASDTSVDQTDPDVGSTGGPGYDTGATGPGGTTGGATSDGASTGEAITDSGAGTTDAASTDATTSGTDTLCGDGIVQGEEECDGAELQGLDCPDFDRGDGGAFERGRLTCNSDCTYNTTACSSCGDGRVTGEELCDGENLAGESCASNGYTGGSMACSVACDGFVFDDCTTCGDGSVEGVEACDCAGGTCTPTGLADQSCQDQGFDGGSLGCTDICTLELSGCESFSCGDGIVNGPDACDCGGDTCTADELAGTACTDLQRPNGDPFTGGTLGCRDGEGESCTFDDSGCTWCGDGAVNGTSESCDGADLAGQSCTSRGFATGSLACTSACAFDESACSMCGNGVVDPGEECDCGTDACTPAELDDQTCADAGFEAGDLGCTDSCTVDTSACSGGTCWGEDTPPGGSCPSSCTGGCTADTCVVDCTTPGSCIGDTVSCPANWKCQVDCGGSDVSGGCEGLSVSCPGTFACALNCVGENACVAATVSCGQNPCEIRCDDSPNSCLGAVMTCSTGACRATCDGASAPSVSCNAGSACDCTACN